VEIFDDFKAKVIEGKDRVIGVRKGIEDFKTKHEMANRAISALIDGLPPPFNKFGDVIWDGLKKQDDSDGRMLETLEKIAKSSEEEFLYITKSIDILFENNASKDDLKSLGEEIFASNKGVVEILDRKVRELVSIVQENLDKSKQIDSTTRETLAVTKRIERLVTTRSDKQIQEPNKVQLHPRLYRGEKRTFVGRVHYLDRIREHLKDPGTRVSIVGLGGTGKSALAFQALHQCESMFYQIIPLYFASQFKIDDYISTLAKALSVSIEELEKHDI
jgi:hypothetical protein